jgi:hypothetical protein
MYLFPLGFSCLHRAPSRAHIAPKLQALVDFLKAGAAKSLGA